ncbi:hypothetical protein KC331_g24 [Hortaea werneckii]|nr:hypothetical protein KC331_g24 [Hortaea werneckii]
MQTYPFYIDHETILNQCLASLSISDPMPDPTADYVNQPTHTCDSKRLRPEKQTVRRSSLICSQCSIESDGGYKNPSDRMRKPTSIYLMDDWSNSVIHFKACHIFVDS